MKSSKARSAAVLFAVIGSVIVLGGQTLAATTTVNLGTADPFAVLAYSLVTNIPTSAIIGNVGLSPAAGSNYSGLTALEVTGTIYAVDGTGPIGATNNPGLLTTAKNDLTTAYTDASGRTGATVLTGGDNQLGGKTLTPGVYSFSHATTANLTAASPLTLSGNGVFIFQASSDLITASASHINLINGAQACNVFWTVPSSASSIGTNSFFVGTIMAYSSINLMTGANVQGRVLAQTAAVTLDHNTITRPATCLATNYIAAGTPNTGFGVKSVNHVRGVAILTISAVSLIAFAIYSRRLASK